MHDECECGSVFLLYSVYSWPNIVLPLFGGFLVDRVFGVRLGAIVFSFLVCAGQVRHRYNTVRGYIYMLSYSILFRFCS